MSIVVVSVFGGECVGFVDVACRRNSEGRLKVLSTVYCPQSFMSISLLKYFYEEVDTNMP